MTYETKTSKGYDGWQAVSEAEIGQTAEGPRILKLRTAKTRGGIAASASACTPSMPLRSGAFGCLSSVPLSLVFLFLIIYQKSGLKSFAIALLSLQARQQAWL